ncbi:MAG: hypothetical protein KDA60_20180 [Planctomycetales bacterium]|nr:hypothetical protein [Planctomycetales bacterium]
MVAPYEVIYRTSQSYTAHLLAALLRDYGVRATVVGDRTMEPEFFTPTISVSVARDDLEMARGIAQAFEKHVANARTGESAGDDAQTFPEYWQDWPVCRGCRKPRDTACVYCGTAGYQFPLADQPVTGSERATSAESPPLLVCHICDEPFTPEFLRTCPWCGLDHGSGRNAEDGSVHHWWSTRHPQQVAVIAVLTLLAIMVLLLL